MAGGTVCKFVVAVSQDRRRVAVFTPTPIDEGGINAALRQAAKQWPDAHLVEATHVNVPADAGFRLGTAGALTFDTPQPEERLVGVQKAIAEALIATGFGLFE